MQSARFDRSLATTTLWFNGEGETAPALAPPDAPPEEAVPATATAIAGHAAPEAGLSAALPPPSTGGAAAGLTTARPPPPWATMAGGYGRS